MAAIAFIFTKLLILPRLPYVAFVRYRQGQLLVLVSVIVLVLLSDQGVMAMQLVLLPMQSPRLEGLSGQVLSLSSHSLVQNIAVVGLFGEEIFVFFVGGHRQEYADEADGNDIDEGEVDLGSNERLIHAGDNDG